MKQIARRIGCGFLLRGCSWHANSSEARLLRLLMAAASAAQLPPQGTAVPFQARTSPRDRFSFTTGGWPLQARYQPTVSGGKSRETQQHTR